MWNLLSGAIPDYGSYCYIYLSKTRLSSIIVSFIILTTPGSWKISYYVAKTNFSSKRGIFSPFMSCACNFSTRMMFSNCNPPINFRALSLDETLNVVQKRSGLTSVVQFYWQEKNEKGKHFFRFYLYRSNHRVIKSSKLTSLELLSCKCAETLTECFLFTGILEDNALGWKIVLKISQFPRSFASRPTVHFLDNPSASGIL